MVNLRNLLAKLKTRWINLRQLVKSNLNYGIDGCLELIMIGGGINQIAGLEPWKYNCLTLYRLLGFYQFIMVLARVGYSIQNHDDLIEICASIMIAATLATGYLKVYILEHYDEIVRNSKTFLSSNTSYSKDSNYDALVRRHAARFAGKVTLAIFLLICCDQVVLLVPNSARNRIFGIPKQCQALGLIAAGLLQEAFVLTLIVFWGCRYLCCSLTILPILMGLRSELMIVARGYVTIEERVPAHLKQILGTTLEQHVEVLRNIQLVRPFVNIMFAVTYYSAMIFVSIYVLLVIRGGFTLISIVMVLSGCCLIGECYFWCHLIESIKEITENIADSAAQLGYGLEHSLKKHSEYVEMRTSLTIIQLNASRSELFSCGGFFPISVELFGNLGMIIYRLATFLLKFY